MKRIIKWIKPENEEVSYWKSILVIFLGVIFIAGIIHLLGWLWSLTGVGIGDFDGWLSFWGSFLGGIISGTLTLIGVMLAFKLQKSATIKARIIEHYADTLEMLMFLDKLLIWLGEKDMTNVAAEKKRIECEDICVLVKKIDPEIYIKLKYICVELSSIRDDLLFKGTTERTVKLKGEVKSVFLETKKYISKP